MSEAVPDTEEPGRRAFEHAVEALSVRERTTAEVLGLLADAGYPPGEANAAVERLIEIGELDDELFARRYAEDKRELSGWGADRIREALASKGLDRETIDTAIGSSDTEELERAVALLERRGEAAGDERARSRAVGYLARRGYDSETAHDAVRRFAREQRFS